VLAYSLHNLASLEERSGRYLYSVTFLYFAWIVSLDNLGQTHEASEALSASLSALYDPTKLAADYEEVKGAPCRVCHYKKCDCIASVYFQGAQDASFQSAVEGEANSDKKETSVAFPHLKFLLASALQGGRSIGLRTQCSLELLIEDLEDCKDSEFSWRTQNICQKVIRLSAHKKLRSVQSLPQINSAKSVFEGFISQEKLHVFTAENIFSSGCRCQACLDIFGLKGQFVTILPFKFCQLAEEGAQSAVTLGNLAIGYNKALKQITFIYKPYLLAEGQQYEHFVDILPLLEELHLDCNPLLFTENLNLLSQQLCAKLYVDSAAGVLKLRLKDKTYLKLLIDNAEDNEWAALYYFKHSNHSLLKNFKQNYQDELFFDGYISQFIVVHAFARVEKHNSYLAAYIKNDKLVFHMRQLSKSKKFTVQIKDWTHMCSFENIRSVYGQYEQSDAIKEIFLNLFDYMLDQWVPKEDFSKQILAYSQSNPS